MTRDICDGEVGLDSSSALRDWNAMIRAFLAHGAATPSHLNAVLDAAPDFAMGHAAKGLFSLLMGRRELVETARACRRDADRALVRGGASRRERLWCEALAAWLDGHPSGTIAALETALSDNPRDTLSMKLSHAVRFILGDAAGMRRSVERVIAAHDEAHPCRGYALGCHAFALEETGDYAQAEATGREGLAFAADDAWGLHAVAHVYDMTARADDGIRLIAEHDGAWLHCNNFRYHVWWHKALLHLDRGEIDEVLRLYDDKIRHDRTDDYRDIANATSLLARLELEGVAVGERWVELADFAERRVDDGCLVFADLHYMLALTGDGREDGIDALLGRIARDARRRDSEVSEVVADPGMAAANGLAAFGEGRYDVAFRDLRAARSRMQRVGGSHAQRDVFERMTVDAGLRAGYLDGAEAILIERRDRRGGAEDAFATSRMAAIDAARRAAERIPAE